MKILGSSLFVLLMAFGAQADESHSFQCHRTCKISSLKCAKADPRSPYCRTSAQDCLGSCDVANGTAQPVTYSVAREEPLLACRQRCGLSRSTCEGGGNAPALCETGRNACVARCDSQFSQ